jgi:cell division protein FtsB
VTLDLHFVVTTLLGLVCAVLGWFGRELWSAVQQLQRDLSALEVRIGTDYVRYDRLQDALRPVIQHLATISETLAHKADKS